MLTHQTSRRAPRQRSQAAVGDGQLHTYDAKNPHRRLAGRVNRKLWPLAVN